MDMKRQIKLGHQAPKGYRDNRFNEIMIRNTDLSYCESHNFVYDSEVQSQLLYLGLPNYYTDIRYRDGRFNSYKQCVLHWTRFKEISLKSCI